MIKIFNVKIVTKYILKEYLLTFLITFLFFFVIFFINHILVNIKQLFEKNIPFNLIVMMMVTFFPMIVLFSLPFATMLSTLMTMGRFSSDNEIIAFRALGFSYIRVFLPIFICGIIFSITTFYVNDRLIPSSWHQQKIIIKKIQQIKPSLNLKSKTIKKYNVSQTDVKTIFTNIVKENKIIGLFILDKDQNNQKRIITANEAEILTPEGRDSVIELRMNDTMIQIENKDRPNEFNFGYSDRISYYIDLQEFTDIDPSKTHGIYKTTWENLQDVLLHKKIDTRDKIIKNKNIINLKESTEYLFNKNEDYLNNNITYNSFVNNLKKIDTNLKNLFNLKKSLKEEKNGFLNESLIELYRKFTNPFACIIFAIFAAPIGIYSRRAGFSIGFVIGLFLTAFYWFSLSGTMLMGRRFLLTPFIAMSLPNLLFLIIGLYFLYKRLKE